ELSGFELIRFEPGFLPPQQIRKIHPRGFPQRMPAPGPRVEIENLVVSVPGVEFELHFGHSVESDAFQEPAAGRFHLRLAYRLYVRACITELDRILPHAASGERGSYPPLFADPAK